MVAVIVIPCGICCLLLFIVVSIDAIAESVKKF